MSTIPETISVLEKYNKWRRGDETIPMPDPFEIGVAIGDAVRLLRELTAEREKVRVLRVAMVVIIKCGGMNIETELGEILCNGSWCAEQARAALAATKEGAK